MLRSDENDDRCLPPRSKRLRDSLRGRRGAHGRACDGRRPRRAAPRDGRVRRREDRGEGLRGGPRGGAARARARARWRDERTGTRASRRSRSLQPSWPPSAARRSTAARRRGGGAIDVQDCGTGWRPSRCTAATRPPRSAVRRLAPRDCGTRVSTGRGGERRRGFFAAADPAGWASSTSSRSRTGACWTRRAGGGGRRRGAREKSGRGHFAACPRRRGRLVLWTQGGTRRWSRRSSATRGSQTVADAARRQPRAAAGGTVEGRPRSGPPRARRGFLEFPRAFSRYSTLERARRRAERW